MRLHVVSDVHGRSDALARAGDGADGLICLGDLLLFLDYDDPGEGLVADLFGAEAAVRLIGLRTAREFDQAREYSGQLWSRLGGSDEARAAVETRVRAQYDALFAAMPTPAYVTYGNVDVPALFRERAQPGMTILDGQVVELGGRTFGFVGGGLRTAMRTPFERGDAEYAAAVAAVGAVDVLCCHIPPAVPDLLFDVRGRRLERGSEALLDAIRDTAPSLVLFGHVHNPLAARRRIGRTECRNVGFFRRTGRPFVLQW